MSVQNVKVSNIRPKYSNLKEWMQDPNNVYIGRAGVFFIDGVRYPPTQSIFANPYKIDKNCAEDIGRDDAIIKYKNWITQKIQSDPKIKSELLALKGKTLGCWCKPKKCHGDVILELINLYS
jgi:hypothetical protein